MAPTYPAGSEEATILDVVNSLLAAIPSKDVSKMLAPTYPQGGAQTNHGGELEAESIESLLTKICGMPGDLGETFHEVEIKVDGTGQLAMLWAKSKVLVDGKVMTEGTNAITLHKVEGRWRISSISDVSGPVEGTG